MSQLSSVGRDARGEPASGLDAPRGSTRTPAGRAAAALVVGALGVVVLILLVSSRIGGLGLVGLLVPAVLAGAAITATAPVDRAFGLVCFFVAALPLGAFDVGPLQVVQLLAVPAPQPPLADEVCDGPTRTDVRTAEPLDGRLLVVRGEERAPVTVGGDLPVVRDVPDWVERAEVGPGYTYLEGDGRSAALSAVDRPWSQEVDDEAEVRQDVLSDGRDVEVVRPQDAPDGVEWIEWADERGLLRLQLDGLDVSEATELARAVVRADDPEAGVEPTG